MEKRREDLIMCPNCQVPNSPDSSECYGCGFEFIKESISIELSRNQARFLRTLLNIFWTSFNRWTPFGKLADEFPASDLITLADALTRKLEHLLGER